MDKEDDLRSHCCDVTPLRRSLVWPSAPSFLLFLKIQTTMSRDPVSDIRNRRRVWGGLNISVSKIRTIRTPNRRNYLRQRMPQGLQRVHRVQCGVMLTTRDTEGSSTAEVCTATECIGDPQHCLENMPTCGALTNRDVNQSSWRSSRDYRGMHNSGGFGITTYCFR